jgi:GT2 family glycosyltransferase/glycosyltransferase involved in cell wall biosynthesis
MLDGLGVVVLTHGNAPDPGRLLADLERDGIGRDAVVVVHNRVHDVDLPPRVPAGIEVLSTECNRGYGGGMNHGIRHHLAGGARLVLLLPQDVLLHPGAVPTLLLAMRDRPRLGVAGPALRWRGSDAVFSLGGYTALNGSVGHRTQPPEDGELLPCDWVDGAAMILRREVLDEVGLLEERFFMYFEEPEFCLRARRAGWEVGVVLDAVAEQSPGLHERPGAFAYLLARNGVEYARLVAGWHGARLRLAGHARDAWPLLRTVASPRASREQREATVGTLRATARGVVDFQRRRFGPPPATLRGLGDMRGSVERAGAHVLVSTFPPRRDGIARYAAQAARDAERTRAVVRLGLPGSHGHQVVRLDGGLRALRLLVESYRGDRVEVMWHPELYVSGRCWSRVLSYLGLAAVARARPLRVVVHEPESDLGEAEVFRWPVTALEGAARRAFWRGVRELVFHSEHERSVFEEHVFGGRRARAAAVVAHGSFFRPYAEVDRTAARAVLGLGGEACVFLCIGFLGEHKGFDRALEAFMRARRSDARLFIVGSGLYDTPAIHTHIAGLRRRTAAVSGAELREGYVSDEAFDQWLAAADAVLAPYREIASSSVVARAQLIGTPVIATAVGALPEQLGPKDILVRSDYELVAALRSFPQASSSVSAA